MHFFKILSVFLIVWMVLVSAMVFDRLPSQVASHWDADGKVNGYMGRFWGAFFIPLLSGFLVLLFTYLPKMDPLGDNVKSFMEAYERMVFYIIFYMFLIHSIILGVNVGIDLDIGRSIFTLTGGLFFGIGSLLDKTKRNWFIGVRTPWTLSSDSIWERTHTLASRLFMGSGILTVFAVAFNFHPFAVMIGTILASVLYSIIFSYIEFKSGKTIKGG